MPNAALMYDVEVVEVRGDWSRQRWRTDGGKMWLVEMSVLG